MSHIFTYVPSFDVCTKEECRGSKEVDSLSLICRVFMASLLFIEVLISQVRECQVEEENVEKSLDQSGPRK